MKLLLCFVGTSLLFTSLHSQEMFVRGGIDLVGTHTIEGSGTDVSDDATGSSLGLEVTFPASEKLDIGGGVSFGSQREVKKWDGKFSTVPIYALAHLKLTNESDHPYIGVRMGYASFSANSTYIGDGSSDGGFYWGLIAGYSYKLFNIELAYQNQTASAFNNAGFSYDVGYGRLSLNAGLRFKLK